MNIAKSLTTALDKRSRARKLGYRPHQIKLDQDGNISEVATGRIICPFLQAPIETETTGDTTKIRIFGKNSNHIINEANAYSCHPA